MKILRLTNSNDVLAGATPERPRLLAEKLEAYFGEPFEIVVKTPWPTPALPSVVDKWLDREQPDAVFLHIPNYWVSYPSVPLRLARLLGRPGTWLARLGFAAAENPLIGPSLPFRLGRQVLLRTIGGDYHFEPEEVAACVEAIAHRILQRESLMFAVWGPHGRYDWSVTGAQKRKARDRQAQLVASLQQISRELRFPYSGRTDPAYLTGETPELAADRFHFAPSFGVASAEEQFTFYRDVIETARLARRPR
ncbi:hypothetical protein [Tepidiforma sp.]|uniref:hypothetical protein n=1 Tax=Tepidiforma sp. TaxID=2682230 RepID=UPI002ADD9F35|nr:hypothetical protein [Tepidiforma sp.]